jgi:hypothetical protein
LVAGLLGLITPYLTLAVCVVIGAVYLLVPARMPAADDSGKAGDDRSE